MIDTPPSLPEHDIVARNLAERIFSAYLRSATGPMHPQQEQSLLARLAEALRSRIGSLDGELLAAANMTLDAWEQAEPEIRGGRVASIDVATQAVTLQPPD